MTASVKTKLLSALMNIAGSGLLAFGVCAFIMPYDLIVGGATGISLIVHRLTGINVSIIAYAINLAMLPIGYWKGGKKLVLGSVLSSLVYPTALAVFERIPALGAIADSTIMAALCGGVVCGCGIGLVMKSGGSTGGLDIPVLLAARKLRVPAGTVMNGVDTCIMICQIPLFGLTSIVYGLLYTFIMTRTINTVLTLGQDRIRLSVVSEKYEDIRRVLIENDFGVTMICAESGYTHTPILKLESVMISSRGRRARQLVEQTDPEAFITVEHVKDVRGQGFTTERVFIELE